MDLAGYNVPRTQSAWGLNGQEKVAGTNPEAELRSNLCVHKRRFKFHRPAIHAARHRSAIFVNADDDGIKQIFDARELGYGFQLRGAHHLVGRALCNDASSIEHDNLFAESKDLLPAVRDVKNRDIVSAVPGP